MTIVFLGLSITSSWGNGHATTYRGLVRELVARGHEVLFLERDAAWYAQNRDLPQPPYGATRLYDSLEELRDRYADTVRRADCVIVGSYVPEGVAVAEWVTTVADGVTVFYDIDTPVTIAALSQGGAEYLSPQLVRRFSLYLSFTGGPILDLLQRVYGARRVGPLYCSFDPLEYFPEPSTPAWDIGYMGTYSIDRQPPLERLLLDAARQWPEGRVIVAGPSYPPEVSWPPNVARIVHLPPAQHRAFYCSQRFTLNLTRADMIRAGYSPSVRLFEAAGCGTPVISDWWRGLDRFFQPGREILVTTSAADTLNFLRGIDEEGRLAIGARARERALREHTAAHRAEQLEAYVVEARAEVRAR